MAVGSLAEQNAATSAQSSELTADGALRLSLWSWSYCGGELVGDGSIVSTCAANASQSADLENAGGGSIACGMTAAAFESGTLYNATPIPPTPIPPPYVFYRGGGSGGSSRGGPFPSQRPLRNPRTGKPIKPSKPGRIRPDEDDDLESITVGSLAVSDAKKKRGQRVRVSFGGERIAGAANDNSAAEPIEPTRERDTKTTMVVGSAFSLALLALRVPVHVAILPLAAGVLLAHLPVSKSPDRKLPAWIMVR